MKATVFEFVSSTYEAGSPDIFFTYRVHFSDTNPVDFTEKITLSDKEWSKKLPSDFVKNIVDDLHLVLGTSYYKTFCPPEFKTSIFLTEKQTTFWNALYKKGLSEFLYRNKIAPDTVAQFTANSDVARTTRALDTDENKLLVGIGGGKDSIVALKLLEEFDLTGFVKSDGFGDILAKDVAEVTNMPLEIVGRRLDEKILAGIPGAYNGHIPISSVYAFLGVLHAALQGSRYFVVANEHSSNFGNLVEEGNEVNHKWSGSSEFEILFQTYVREQLTSSVGYFSITRPFYELRVVKMFTTYADKYFGLFSSCNRNFAHNHDMGGKRWCGECPKCAFAYLMLAAFLDKDVLLRIFKKNLFEDATLLPLYKDLLGLGDMKPFDCVGTFDESKVALAMAAKKHDKALVVKTFLSEVGDTDALTKKVFSTQKADTVPTRFRMLGMESVLILGYGKEGKTTEKYIADNYPTVQIDIADRETDSEYLNKQEDFDIVIKTPVIPSTLVTSHFTTATNIFFSSVSRKNIIGVTGSKGKSTTATLLHQMLDKAGVKTRLVGNIGSPALESLLEKPVEDDELFVFELSSYQLADIDISPHVAVVTSLFPEHLDYHGTLDAYYDAKRNITRFQSEEDAFVYNPSFSLLEDWASETKAKTFSFSDHPLLINNLHLLGQHNQQNAELAYTAARMFSVAENVIAEVLSQYQGLPHRLMNVGMYKGVTFYDDSISTTPESAIAALEALKNVHTIILGGVDRGYDFTLLEECLRKQGVKTVILFPESGKHMLRSEEGFEVLHTESMDEAVQYAYEHTAEGTVCLLSPAAPSYNLFTNFEERGDTFKEMVEKYGKI